MASMRFATVLEIDLDDIRVRPVLNRAGDSVLLRIECAKELYPRASMEIAF